MKIKDFESSINNLKTVVTSKHKFKVRSKSLKFVYMDCENCNQTIKVQSSTGEIDRKLNLCKCNFNDLTYNFK